MALMVTFVSMVGGGAVDSDAWQHLWSRLVWQCDVSLRLVVSALVAEMKTTIVI